MINIIPPRCGTSFLLAAGQRLTVIDPQGEQVSDMLAFNAADRNEYLSSGLSIDYNDTLFLTKGHTLYSNRSNAMMAIIEDKVGQHDFTLAPCSAELFRKQYGETHPHHGCHGNLAQALAPYNIGPDRITTAFNIFMNVQINPANGRISVEPPLSKPGDYIVFESRMNLIVALTACAAGKSTNYTYKPVHYEIT